MRSVLGSLTEFSNEHNFFSQLDAPIFSCIWSLSASQQSLVTSLTFMGTGTGGIFIGPLSDRWAVF